MVLGIPAAYHVGASIAAALSLNISRGGIAISAPLMKNLDALADRLGLAKLETVG